MGEMRAPNDQQSVDDAGEDETFQAAYRILAVDGTEITVDLGTAASVYDCYEAVATAKGLLMHQVRLVVSGEVEPLACSRSAKLRGACGGARDLLAIVSRACFLGKAIGPLAACCEGVEFQHFPAIAYRDTALEVSTLDMEVCQGQKITMSPGSFKQTGVGCGALFRRCPWQPLDAATDCPALSGRVLMRIVVHHRSYAFGIGAGTDDVDLSRDPEHDRGFYGLYHGGATKNVAARAVRTTELLSGMTGMRE